MARPGRRGALAIVLHTHMPYVEGFGTWPFGEEWLWEAMACCYLPLLELLDAGAPLTLSLTPVLCDQLEVPGVAERFAAFVEGPSRDAHERDAVGLRASGHETMAREIERSSGDYAHALQSLRERGGDLLGALAPHAQWTSAATHAVLPLLATEAGARLQVQSGVKAQLARFGAGWRGGFWLPECAYAPWIGATLKDAGVRASCVELTNRLGLGSSEHLRPIATESGVVLVPIDRRTMSLAWSDGGYPAGALYRDYHRRTIHHRNAWSNGGGVYEHAAALALAREHSRDFVARTLARLREAGESAPGGGLPGGGLVVFAVDTELFGHWWYEGLEWLRGVVEECSRQGLELVRLDDALERDEPASGRPPAGADSLGGGDDWPAISWGQGGDLSTWSGPAVAEMAFQARAAELEVLAAGARASAVAARELLALQASDWAFMIARELASPYGHERFAGHRRALGQALAGTPADDRRELRNIAVHVERAALLEP